MSLRRWRRRRPRHGDFYGAYQHAVQLPGDGQRRFINGTDLLLKIYEILAKATGPTMTGIPVSRRSPVADEALIRTVVSGIDVRTIHIHIAESSR